MHTPRTTNAGVVVALATIAITLAGCSEATQNGQAAARDSGDPTSASTPAGDHATAGTQSSGTQSSSGAAIVGKFPDGALRPGRYALPPVGPINEPLAVVDVGAGYSSWAFFIEADEPVEPGDPLMIGLWAMTGVYLDPCAESDEVYPRSVRATADALVRQKLTSASTPRPVDLGGYHGLYLEITTPMHLDYAACSDDEVNLWEGRPEGGYWTVMPGMVNRLWILDVSGQPMAIELAIPPSATSRQIRAATDIVETATFETPQT
jgi:hypothetical protein